MVKLFFLGVYSKQDDVTLKDSATDLSKFSYFQRNSANEFLKFTEANIAVVVISDEDYPPKAAHIIISKIIEEYPRSNLEAYLKLYQDPKEADPVVKLQSDLDETKIILHSTIANLLKRGEKLDDLVAKSDDLSSQSKLFYKTARKTTRCCEIF